MAEPRRNADNDWLGPELLAFRTATERITDPVALKAVTEAGKAMVKRLNLLEAIVTDLTDVCDPTDDLNVDLCWSLWRRAVEAQDGQ